MHAIDYLITRPEVDPARIGAMGCSGGGTITALTTALDFRVATAGVACYTTSFDTLLPSIGPQDGEQSIPGFIAGGPPSKDASPLDFPDWIELAAPRPYAVIATYSDMFPFAGARTTVIEARRFYALFDPAFLSSRSAAEGSAVFRTTHPHRARPQPRYHQRHPPNRPTPVHHRPRRPRSTRPHHRKHRSASSCATLMPVDADKPHRPLDPTPQRKLGCPILGGLIAKGGKSKSHAGCAP